MKIKKIIIIVLISILGLMALGYIFCMVDHTRAENRKAPIFAIYFGKEEAYPNDGIYYGIGYTVVKCPKGQDNVEEYISKYELGFYYTKHTCISILFADSE